VLGAEVPARAYPVAMLLFTQLLMPHVSFVGSDRAPRPAPRARPTHPAPCAPAHAAAKPRGGRHLVGVLGGGALSSRLLDAALLSAANAVRRARAAQRRAHPRARRGGVSLDSLPRGALRSSQRTPVHRMCWCFKRHVS
jgi:hypothetical protein